MLWLLRWLWFDTKWEVSVQRMREFVVDEPRRCESIRKTVQQWSIDGRRDGWTGKSSQPENSTTKNDRHDTLNESKRGESKSNTLTLKSTTAFWHQNTNSLTSTLIIYPFRKYCILSDPFDIFRSSYVLIYPSQILTDSYKSLQILTYTFRS